MTRFVLAVLVVALPAFAADPPKPEEAKKAAKKLADAMSAATLKGDVSEVFDHTYEGVKRDFHLYSPLVAPGGLVGLHDIVRRPDQPRIEVWKFWDELKASCRESREWIETRPGHRSIGIGVIAMPS